MKVDLSQQAQGVLAQLAAAGVEVTDQYAHDYIESAVAALFQTRFGEQEIALTA